MLFLIQLLSLLHYVSADMEPGPVHYPLEIDGDNILVTALWAMGVCSCVNLVCQQKNKCPIKITQIKQYDDENDFYITKETGGDLQKLKDNIEELKNAIDHLIIEEKVGEYKKIKDKMHIDEYINPQIKYMFGEGPLQYRKEGKYYHGTDIYNMKKWIKGNGGLHRFFERIDGKKLKWDLGTTDHTKYCNNCSYDNDNSKNRTVFNVYQCNGHELYNEPKIKKN